MLRPWRDEDLEPFRALNADRRVMQYFRDVLSAEQSDALASGIRRGLQERDFGLWAVEVTGVADFIGFVGLSIPSFESHFTPCIEIGWRLAAGYWGQGYASEAASAVLDYAFGPLARDEIVSFTAIANRRSIGVMERVGMLHSPADDFDHPSLPVGHSLRRLVLYRLAQADWQSGPK